ncbi:ankyrin-2 [Phialemonium atrogriseum]|uniref:Ankyrin-2 n=1 Tax=Phialemonium atrogriseum TaxID=1093897 RepID=A0AAJ0FEE2_9PEZI|nr:ankyrin-2 [Phialemonium atrogriseum]KAK1764247.1 ankyrin-2 [Phialemonium atrogriseum]
MHWSASVAQLLATGIMVIVRLAIYRKISMMPRTSQLPRGYELDAMAKIINGCQDWRILTPHSTQGLIQALSQDTSRLATRVLQTRIRLGQLSGWSSECAQVVDQVSQAMEAVLNHVYNPNGDVTIKQSFQQKAEFEWNLGVAVAKDEKDFRGKLKIVLRRSKSEDKWTRWRVQSEEVEAALSLWMSHFSQTSTQSRNLWIIGPNTPLNQIVYDWWIHRGTDGIRIDDVESYCALRFVDKSRVFDVDGSQWRTRAADLKEAGLLAAVTNDSLPRMCGQFLLGCFIKSTIACVQELDGATRVTPGTSPGQFLLVNNAVRGLADALQQSGLVSIEDSYRLAVPALNDASILPGPFDVLEDIVAIAKAKGDTVDTLDNTFTRLIYVCRDRAKTQSCEEHWAKAGRTFTRLIEILSNAMGPHAASTLKAKEAMDQFAIDFMESSISTSIDDKDRLRGFDEPFRLHAASSKGLIGQVLQALLDGVGVDTWDDEHETPISLAIKRGYLDIARLVIFYGAPVDHDLLSIAIDKNGNGLYPNCDQMVRLLLLNLQNQTEVLLEACEKGYSMIELLLEIGIDATVKDSKGFTPLHIASMNGFVKVVEILLAKNADVAAKTPNGQTALHLAVERGHNEVVMQLLNAKASLDSRNELGQTPLHIAAERDILDIIKILVERGADPNGRQADGKTALHIAAFNNNAEVVGWLMDHGGVDIVARDKDQATALHLATRNRHDKVIEILTEAREVVLRAKDKYGQTPLIVASREDGRESMIRIMIERGADMAARDESGRGPLEYAASSGHAAAVRLLVEKGAPRDNRDGFGRTALHYASMSNHTAIVSPLVDGGAPIDAIDKDGWTALHYAYCTESWAVVDLLTEKGADPSRKDRLGRTAESYRDEKFEINFWTRALPPPYPKVVLA